MDEVLLNRGMADEWVPDEGYPDSEIAERRPVGWYFFTITDNRGRRTRTGWRMTLAEAKSYEDPEPDWNSRETRGHSGNAGEMGR